MKISVSYQVVPRNCVITFYISMLNFPLVFLLQHPSLSVYAIFGNKRMSGWFLFLVFFTLISKEVYMSQESQSRCQQGYHFMCIFNTFLNLESWR